MKTKKHTGISSDTLKYIAIITMLLDHISYRLPALVFFGANDPAIANRLSELSNFLNGIGRIAFPIFAYQLVQGFLYTKSRLKYAKTLLIFGLLSELPFNLYFYSSLMYFNHQNVMFELLTALAMLSVLEYVNSRLLKVVKALCADIFVTLVFALFAQALHLDYGAKGIILISSIYILYNSREMMSIICPILFITSFYPVNHFLNHFSSEAAINSAVNEIPAFISFFLIYFDNCIRKTKGRRKYIFYAFYPLHLIALLIMLA